MTQSEKRLVYTPEQVAERWACDPKTVRNMLNSGDLTGFRVGQKLWRIRAEKLEEYELGKGRAETP